MKYPFAILFVLTLSHLKAQKNETHSLPLKTYIALCDSTTSVDVVILAGSGESISIEGNNVHYFNTFIQNSPTSKTVSKEAGTMMWEINGKEFMSGKFYLADSSAYIVFNQNGKEYVDRISAQGITFLKNQIK